MCKSFSPTWKISSHVCFMWKFVQVEFHPRLYQKELLEYCRRKGIQLQAYTSLGQGKVCRSSLWPLDIHFVLWTWILKGLVAKQLHACETLTDMKDSGDIKNNQDIWLLTYQQCTNLVSPSKLQLPLTLGTCKLYYVFSSCQLWENCTIAPMHMTIFLLGTATIWDWGKSMNYSTWCFDIQI